MQACHGVVDAFRPQFLSFEPDKQIVQQKADALLLSDEEYSWYGSRLRIEPASSAYARQFVKCVLAVLKKATNNNK